MERIVQNTSWNFCMQDIPKISSKVAYMYSPREDLIRAFRVRKISRRNTKIVRRETEQQQWVWWSRDNINKSVWSCDKWALHSVTYNNEWNNDKNDDNEDVVQFTCERTLSGRLRPSLKFKSISLAITVLKPNVLLKLSRWNSPRPM